MSSLSQVQGGGGERGVYRLAAQRCVVLLGRAAECLSWVDGKRFLGGWGEGGCFGSWSEEGLIVLPHVISYFIR
jgi:hypothetical protein